MMSANTMIGCRVSALFGDGYYAPATIQKVIGNGNYLVKFDDNEIMECSGENMIGDKFKNISHIKLQRFQKVYTTHKDLELCGYVQECNDNVVVISIVDPVTRQKEIISRKIEDISLLEKRMDNGNFCKTRPVSASIEVPKPSRVCRTSEEPTMTELMAAMVLSNLSCSPVFHNPASQIKGSDPHSFDSSGVGSWNPETHHLSPPRSSVIQHTPRESDPTSTQTPPPQRLLTPDNRSEYDSGMILIDRSPLTYNDDDDQMNVDEKPQDLRIPKPNLKETSPKHISTDPNQATLFHPAPHQLDVVMEQEEAKKQVPLLNLPFPHNIRLPYFIPAGLVQPIYGSSLPADFRIQLASTPPHHSPDVEPAAASSLGHIDNKMHRHLHRTIPYHKSSDDSSSDVTGSPSSNKQGNYFPFSRTPIPVGSLSFSPSHHTKPTRLPFTSKPQQPSTSSTPPVPILQSNPIPEATTYPILTDRNYPLGVSPGQPINIPGAKAFSWHSSGLPMYTNQKPSIVQQRQHLHHGASPKMTFPVSPKSLPLGRKVRGDGKKCRKVYGMENRDMWCTACRWKKACQRFPD